MIVAPSLDAARSLLRDATLRHGALFGWYGTTLALLAGLVREGAEGGQPLATGLAREALAARAIHRASEDGALGRLAPLAGRPGFARALARTLDELGMAEVDDAALAQTGSPLLALRRAYREELAAASLADRADSYRHAADWLAAGGTSALAVVLPYGTLRFTAVNLDSVSLIGLGTVFLLRVVGITEGIRHDFQQVGADEVLNFLRLGVHDAVKAEIEVRLVELKQLGKLLQKAATKLFGRWHCYLLIP